MSARNGCATPIPWEQLVAYWTGELDDSEVDGLDEHLVGCATCSAESGRVTALTQALHECRADGSARDAARCHLYARALTACRRGGSRAAARRARHRQRSPSARSRAACVARSRGSSTSPRSACAAHARHRLRTVVAHRRQLRSARTLRSTRWTDRRARRRPVRSASARAGSRRTGAQLSRSPRRADRS